jgi:hypothetical protein
MRLRRPWKKPQHSSLSGFCGVFGLSPLSRYPEDRVEISTEGLTPPWFPAIARRFRDLTLAA